MVQISKRVVFSLLLFVVILNVDASPNSDMQINLPKVRKRSDLSVEEALSRRRSVRDFKTEALTLQEVSSLLWAAQGITSQEGGRTPPSAGALYPLEVYLVAGSVKGLESGIYHYLPLEHSLVKIVSGDKRIALSGACLEQAFIKDAPVSIVICAEYPRTTRKYGERGHRYVHIEVGHAGQNIYLQAEALGLRTVAIGAFNDEQVKRILETKAEPLYVMPVGTPK